MVFVDGEKERGGSVSLSVAFFLVAVLASFLPSFLSVLASPSLSLRSPTFSPRRRPCHL